jgi:hypothetical protein
MVRARTARHSVPQSSPFGGGPGPLFELASISGAAAGQRAGGLGRLTEKIAEFRLSEVRFGDLRVKEIGQSFDDALWQWRLVMAPSPRLHPTDLKVFSYFGIAAKGYFEREIVPTARHFSFEARWGYGIGTHRYRAMMKYSVRAPSSERRALPSF